MSNKSTHAQAAQLCADRALEQGHGGVLVAVKNKARSGDWPRSFVDAFYDRGWDGWAIGQTYAFSSFLSLLASGEVAVCHVEVGATPSRDAAREANASKLRHLPPRFVADVDLEQNCADADGFLRWDETVRLTRWIDDEQRDDAVPFTTIAPLEVGSSAASRTLMHIQDEGAVARWPYGSPQIWIAARLEPYTIDLSKLPA